MSGKAVSIRDLDVTGKFVLVRADFNVPMRDQSISDDSRIRAALPTINHLRRSGAKTIVCSHFGRPKGQVVEEMRLGIVRDRLEKLLEIPVIDAGGPDGDDPYDRTRGMVNGDVALLENLRFTPAEEENDDAFAAELAKLAEIYVNDAFGAAHRAHASTVGVANHIPSAAGFLMEKEMAMLGEAVTNAESPSIAIIGGAKVSDKIQVLQHLASKVDTILIGGGMVAAFYVAQGWSAGAVDLDRTEISAASEILSLDTADIVVPQDVTCGSEFAESTSAETFSADSVPSDKLILDIGPESADQYASIISSARTIVWNGPMGVFEWAAFSNGSRAVAKAVGQNSSCISVVGGGSTAEVVSTYGVADAITHVSTGGGASLEFLEGKTLPGVAALDTLK